MGFGSFVGNLTGGLIGTSDAEKAAKNAKQYSKQAKADILSEYNKEAQDIYSWLNPYLQAGTEALTAYKQVIGAPPDQPVFTPFNFDVSQIEKNPAYQFVRQQGLQAVDRMAAANRGLMSGNRITAAEKYASGLASTEYQNEFNRQLQAYTTNRDTTQLGYSNANTLWGNQIANQSYLTTLGANEANNLSSFRQNLATNRANAYSNSAAEMSAAGLIPAQEKASFINNLISAGSNAAAAYMMMPTPAKPAPQ